MKERPILFSAPMVRAILDGRKTQTRRIVKPQPPAGCEYATSVGSYALCFADGTSASAAPICVPPTPRSKDHRLPSPYGAPGDRLWVRETFCLRNPEHHPERGYWYAATDDVDNPRWTPSIHMPRRASRLTLEVTGVRVERLQAITEADAIAEGCPGRAHFATLWDSINDGEASWVNNPWVWVVEFARAGAA